MIVNDEKSFQGCRRGLEVPEVLRRIRTTKKLLITAWKYLQIFLELKMRQRGWVENLTLSLHIEVMVSRGK